MVEAHGARQAVMSSSGSWTALFCMVLHVPRIFCVDQHTTMLLHFNKCAQGPLDRFSSGDAGYEAVVLMLLHPAIIAAGCPGASA